MDSLYSGFASQVNLLNFSSLLHDSGTVNWPAQRVNYREKWKTNEIDSNRKHFQVQIGVCLQIANKNQHNSFPV